MNDVCEKDQDSRHHSQADPLAALKADMAEEQARMEAEKPIRLQVGFYFLILLVFLAVPRPYAHFMTDSAHEAAIYPWLLGIGMVTLIVHVIIAVTLGSRVQDPASMVRPVCGSFVLFVLVGTILLVRLPSLILEYRHRAANIPVQVMVTVRGHVPISTKPGPKTYTLNMGPEAGSVFDLQVDKETFNAVTNGQLLAITGTRSPYGVEIRHWDCDLCATHEPSALPR